MTWETGKSNIISNGSSWYKRIEQSVMEGAFYDLKVTFGNGSEIREFLRNVPERYIEMDEIIH